jgi:hypothetical protein
MKVEFISVNVNPMQYSVTKGLYKTAINFAIFLIPFLVTQFPEITNLTLGALGYMLVNFLKVKFK